MTTVSLKEDTQFRDTLVPDKNFLDPDESTQDIEDHTYTSISVDLVNMNHNLEYVCPVCPQTFTSERNMKIHKRKHDFNKTGKKTEPFMCPECHVMLATRSSLRIHIESHSNIKTIKCPKCEKCFATSRNLQCHLITHSNHKSIKCCIAGCQKKFKTLQSRNFHLTNHPEYVKHLSRTFKCPVCPKSFNQRCKLLSHLKVHSNTKDYKCTHCDKSFKRKYTMLYHIKTHFSAKPYKCNMCSKTFRINCDLKNHEKIHTGEKPFLCEACGRRFITKSDRSKHVKIHHDPNRPVYKCVKCSKSYLVKAALEDHMHRHNKDLKIFCPEQGCNRVFFTNRASVSHKQLHHSKTTPKFDCKYCGKPCFTKGKLQEHLSHHTGNKPFKCSHINCFKTFGTKTGLKRHLILHSGIKPHVCSKCGKSFTFISHYNYHVRSHYTVEKYKCLMCHHLSTKMSTAKRHVLQVHIGINWERNFFRRADINIINQINNSIEKIVETSESVGETSKTKPGEYHFEVNDESSKHPQEVKVVPTDIMDDAGESKVLSQAHSEIENMLDDSILVKTHTSTDGTPHIFIINSEEIQEQSQETELPISIESIKEEVVEVDDEIQVKVHTRHDTSKYNYTGIQTLIDAAKIDNEPSKEIHVVVNFESVLEEDNQELKTVLPNISGENQNNMCDGKVTNNIAIEIDNSKEDTDFVSENNFNECGISEEPEGLTFNSLDVEQNSSHCNNYVQKEIIVLENPTKGTIRLEKVYLNRSCNDESNHVADNEETKMISVSDEADDSINDNITKIFIKNDQEFISVMKGFGIDHQILNNNENLPNGKSAFMCEKCGNHLESISQLKTHTCIKIRNIQSNLICSQCDQSFTDTSLLMRHKRTHYVKRHECDQCSKCFKYPIELTNHIRTHTGEKPFNCVECGQAMISKNALREHMKSSHSNKAYACGVCGKQFKQRSTAVRHIKGHDSSPAFFCTYEGCGKKFSRKRSFINHEFSHLSEKPFKCDLCDKSYVTKYKLNEHRQKHEGNKAFLCQVTGCGSVLTSRTGYLRHMILHSGQKNFHCDVCSKSFAFVSHLNMHMTSHTGEKRHVCKICGKKYTRSGGLKRHLKSETNCQTKLNHIKA